MENLAAIFANISEKAFVKHIEFNIDCLFGGLKGLDHKFSLILKIMIHDFVWCDITL